jgi:hypothetical protein
VRNRFLLAAILAISLLSIDSRRASAASPTEWACQGQSVTGVTAPPVPSSGSSGSSSASASASVTSPPTVTGMWAVTPSTGPLGKYLTGKQVAVYGVNCECFFDLNTTSSSFSTDSTGSIGNETLVWSLHPSTGDHCSGACVPSYTDHTFFALSGIGQGPGQGVLADDNLGSEGTAGHATCVTTGLPITY